jgi:hypothetical protein
MTTRRRLFTVGLCALALALAAVCPAGAHGRVLPVGGAGFPLEQTGPLPSDATGSLRGAIRLDHQLVVPSARLGARFGGDATHPAKLGGKVWIQVAAEFSPLPGVYGWDRSDDGLLFSLEAARMTPAL